MALVYLELTDITETTILQQLSQVGTEEEKEAYLTSICELAEANFVAFAQSLGVAVADIPTREDGTLSRHCINAMVWDATWRALFDLVHTIDDNMEYAKWRAAKEEYGNALMQLNYSIITNTTPATVSSFTIPRFN